MLCYTVHKLITLTKAAYFANLPHTISGSYISGAGVAPTSDDHMAMLILLVAGKWTWSSVVWCSCQV